MWVGGGSKNVYLLFKEVEDTGEGRTEGRKVADGIKQPSTEIWWTDRQHS